MKFIILLLFTIIFISSCSGSNSKYGDCDISCLTEYVICLSKVEICTTGCWVEYNTYIEVNQVMCREFDGQEKCADRANPDVRRALALAGQKCEISCNEDLKVCERDKKICINDIQGCILNASDENI